MNTDDGCGYKKQLGETLGNLFDECKDRHVFNPINNSINFSARRATDYKLNKNIKLPKPMSSNKELQCELRRTSYMKAFDGYKMSVGSSSSLQRKKAVDNVINGRKTGGKKMNRNTVKNDGRKKLEHKVLCL